MPRKGSSIIRICLFAAAVALTSLSSARADLNPEGSSALDPKTTTVERKGDKLYIRIRQADGKTQEIVKQLEEIKPGTNFYHWTVDRDSPNWMSQGSLPKAILAQYKIPTQERQVHGPGFYASLSPVDAADYGELLTHFEVPAQPQGILGRLKGGSQESFWVLKEALIFPGASQEERNRLAQATYPLLEKEGIAGCHVTGTWYTFFHHNALTRFSPVDPQKFLDGALDSNSKLQQALAQLRAYPENAKTLAAVEGALQQRIQQAPQLVDVQGLISFSDYLESPQIESALRSRMLELAPLMPTDYPGDKLSRLLYFANKKKDPELFEALLGNYLKTSAEPRGGGHLDSALGHLRGIVEDPKIGALIDAFVTSEIQKARNGEELKLAYSLAGRMGSASARTKAVEEVQKKAGELFQAGQLGQGHAAELAALLNDVKEPAPSLLKALAQELSENPKVSWNSSSLQNSLLDLLQQPAGATLRPAVASGLSRALQASQGDDDLYSFAAKLDIPEVHGAVMDQIRTLVRTSNSEDLSGIRKAIKYYNFYPSPNPSQEELREILGLLLKQRKGMHSSFDLYTIYFLNNDLDLHRLAGLRPLVRSFLAKIQATLPPGETLLSDPLYKSHVKALLATLGVADISELSAHANDFDFSLPAHSTASASASASCGQNFQSVATP